SPNDYTPTDEVQTSGGDEGYIDLHELTREVLQLKKHNAKQAAQILRLKTKLKILVKKVKPGRKKVSDGSTCLNEVDVNSGDSQMMDDDTISTEVHEGTAQVNEAVLYVGNESSVGAKSKEEEEERKRLAGLERLQDELEDNEMIAAEVQRIERENFTEEQKAKFLVETIAAQRRFRAEQQAALRRKQYLLPFLS
ncbi:hypothetical protein Tco_1011641, partial [Tanacetum coccineum]